MSIPFRSSLPMYFSTLFVCVLGLLSPLPAFAQTSLGLMNKPAEAVSTAKAKAPAADQLKKLLDESRSELAAIDSPERLATGAPPGTPTKELQQRVRALRLIVFSYRQHINALGNLEEIKKLAADEESKRKAWPGFPDKPPYSVLFVDALRAELQSALLDLHSEESRLKIVIKQSDNAKSGLEKASENQRRAQDILESATPDKLAAATWNRDLATLIARSQAAYLESMTAIQKTVEARIEESRRAADFIQRKIDDAGKSVAFNPEDLEKLKSTLDEQRAETIKALDQTAQERDSVSAETDKALANYAAAEKTLLDLETRLTEANKRLQAAKSSVKKIADDEGLLQKINPFHGRPEKAELDNRQKEVAELEKQLVAARALAKTRDRARILAIERGKNAVLAVDKLNTALVIYEMRLAFWEMRYAAYVSPKKDAQSRKKLIENSRDLLRVLNPAMELLLKKLEITVSQISAQQSLIQAASTPDETAFLNKILELLVEREHAYLQASSEIEGTKNLLLRWMEEQDIRSQGLSAGELAQDWFSLTGQWFQTIWTFELFAVDDSIVVDGRTITGTRGVTVAKVVRALMIVVIGYLLAALLTRLLMKHVIRLGHMDETSARIGRKWILSVTLLVLLFLALDVVKIPLAAFAFLGGAIAIGAGFGMQTLLKNLISGVMLLMERPFKPRDIIEVGGIRGEVTDINVRSCTIKDANGIETLIPNSTFLEQNVTNWTLTNQKVRFALNIGVSYGSPARKVSDLLLEVAHRHNLVLKDPPPEVLFMDFGDNALAFTLYVWLEIGLNRRSAFVVLSDLRFMIDTSFAEHGIEIPFPQRDVHLDASVPLPVRMVAPVDPAAG